MGQYYNIVFKKENAGYYKVYNKDIDDDYCMAKLMEHSWIGNRNMGYATGLLLNTKARMAWVGDYAEKEELEPLGLDAAVIWGTESQKGAGISFDSKKDKCIEEKDYKKYNLINHDKKCYISFENYLNQFDSDDEYIVHPLSLLTAIGNGRGGGDYSGCNEADVGFWAWDLLEVSENVPKGYKKYETLFSEESGREVGKMTMYISNGNTTKRMTIEMLAEKYFKKDMKKAKEIWDKMKDKLKQRGKSIPNKLTKYCETYDKKNNILIIFGKYLNNDISHDISYAYFSTKKDEKIIRTIETICVYIEKIINKKIKTLYENEGVDKKVTIYWQEDKKVNKNNIVEVLLSPQTRENAKDILENVMDAIERETKTRDLDNEVKKWLEEEKESGEKTPMETKVKIIKKEMFSLMKIVEYFSQLKKIKFEGK